LQQITGVVSLGSLTSRKSVTRVNVEENDWKESPQLEFVHGEE